MSRVLKKTTTVVEYADESESGHLEAAEDDLDLDTDEDVPEEGEDDEPTPSKRTQRRRG